MTPHSPTEPDADPAAAHASTAAPVPDADLSPDPHPAADHPQQSQSLFPTNSAEYRRPSASDLLGGSMKRPGNAPARRVLALIAAGALLYVLSIGPAAQYCTPKLDYTRGGRTFTIGVYATSLSLPAAGPGTGSVRESLATGTYGPVLWACSENTYVYDSINGWLSLWGQSLVQSEIVLSSVTGPSGGKVSSGSVNSSLTPKSPSAEAPSTYPSSLSLAPSAPASPPASATNTPLSILPPPPPASLPPSPQIAPAVSPTPAPSTPPTAPTPPVAPIGSEPASPSPVTVPAPSP